MLASRRKPDASVIARKRRRRLLLGVGRGPMRLLTWLRNGEETSRLRPPWVGFAPGFGPVSGRFVSIPVAALFGRLTVI